MGSPRIALRCLTYKGGVDSAVLMVRMYGKEKVETEKILTANERTKSVKVGIRSLLRLTLFLVNQGDPDKERRVSD